MADTITQDTQLAATKEALIAAVVQKELAGSTAIIPHTDYSFLSVKGAKSISIPRFGSFTVADRAEGAAGDATALTSAVDTLVYDKNAYVAWVIDSASEVQSKVDVQLEFARRAASAHARYVDQQLIAVLEASGDAVTTGVISYSIFLEMKATLLGQFADPNSLYFVAGPGTWQTMMAITEFKNAEVYGQGVINTGVFGQAHGVKILIDNNITAADEFYMYDKNALAIAYAQGASYSEQGANEYGSMAKRCVLDQLFGVKALQIGVAGATGSAGIVKHGN